MELKPNIEFADFLKVDMRIGTVLDCERVPNADKLLRLKVDFGFEQRQILTAMAEFFAPEDFIGKQFPFLINISARTVRGLESRGMLVAADVEGKPVLFTVPSNTPNGSPLM